MSDYNRSTNQEIFHLRWDPFPLVSCKTRNKIRVSETKKKNLDGVRNIKLVDEAKNPTSCWIEEFSQPPLSSSSRQSTMLTIHLPVQNQRKIRENNIEGGETEDKKSEPLDWMYSMV